MEKQRNYSEILNEYQELNKKILDPNITKDPKQLGNLSKRLSELTPIIEKIDEINKLRQELQKTKDLIKSDSELITLAHEEIERLEIKIKNGKEELKKLLTTTDHNDKRNAIIEIRAGTGGDEAALFASDLFRMYTRYAESQNWKVNLLHSNYTGSGGFKEVIALVEGINVYGKLKFESGVHRVQRVPITEASGRIHTSAASVVVLPEVKDIEVEVNPNDLKIDVFRAGGPGGQGVNKTDSAVRITHIPTGIVVSCQDERSQLKNRHRAMSILKSKLFDIEQEKQNKQSADLRQQSIRGGDRSVKIRTYNFQESRITDHRIKKTWYNLQQILNGDLDDLIETTNSKLNKSNTIESTIRP